MSAVVWFLAITTMAGSVVVPAPYPTQQACVDSAKQAINAYPDGTTTPASGLRFHCVPGYTFVGKLP